MTVEEIEEDIEKLKKETYRTFHPVVFYDIESQMFKGSFADTEIEGRTYEEFDESFHNAVDGLLDGEG